MGASSVTFIFGSKTTTRFFSHHEEDWGSPNALFIIFALVLGWVCVLTIGLWKFVSPPEKKRDISNKSETMW